MHDAIIKGTVHHLSPVEHIGQKQMPKRTAIIETDGRYPQYIPIEGAGNKHHAFDNLSKGQQVEIGVFINGRLGKDAYADRAFLSLEVAQILSSGVPPQGKPSHQPTQEAY